MNRLLVIKAANFVIFQLGWLACVLGAARGYPWVGLVAAAIAISLHLKWASHRAAEVRLLVACVLIGLTFDTLLLATDWVAYPGGWWVPGLAPYWMVCLWLLFGTTLNLSMSWMKGKIVPAVILGAIGGPLAYVAGEKLGAITLVRPLNAILALAIGWGTLMPLLSKLAEKWNGFRPISRPDYIHADFDSREVSGHV